MSDPANPDAPGPTKTQPGPTKTQPGDPLSEDRLTNRKILMVGLVAASMLLVGALLWKIIDTGKFADSATVQQALWLSLAVVLLLLVMLAFAIVFKVLNISGGALGLPDGSISAVIAFLLFFLFSLSSIYLYASINGGESQGQQSVGLSRADVEALPSDRIISITAKPTKPETYDVVLAKVNTESTEVGKTAVATISTLLVAVVGFYFGQRTTEKSGQQLKELAIALKETGGSGGPSPNPQTPGSTNPNPGPD